MAGSPHSKAWQLPLIAPGSLIDIAATQAAALDGAEVILDGQTGDELFGLSPYLLADRIRHGRLRGRSRSPTNGRSAGGSRCAPRRG